MANRIGIEEKVIIYSFCSQFERYFVIQYELAGGDSSSARMWPLSGDSVIRHDMIARKATRRKYKLHDDLKWTGTILGQDAVVKEADMMCRNIHLAVSCRLGPNLIWQILRCMKRKQGVLYRWMMMIYYVFDVGYLHR